MITTTSAAPNLPAAATAETAGHYEQFAPKFTGPGAPTDFYRHLAEQPPTTEDERGAAADMLLRHAAEQYFYGNADRADALTRLATAHTFRALN